MKPVNQKKNFIHRMLLFSSKAFIAAILVLPFYPTHASLFFGFGSGAHYSYTNLNPNEKDYFAYNIAAELEYAKKYRYGSIFYSRLDLTETVSNDFHYKFNSYAIGYKYVKPFKFYAPNLSKSAEDKIGGFALFFPFVYLYDFYIFALQNVIPTHPFILTDVFILRDQRRDYGWGAELAPGFTTGYFDLKFPIKSVFYDGFNEIDRYSIFVGAEFTIHFSLNNPIRRESPLIDD